MTPARRVAYLALLANLILWGLAIPFAKRAFVAGLTPTAFLLGRFWLATLVSIPIALAVGSRPGARRALELKNILTIIVLEILGTVISLWLLYEGVRRTSAVEASLLAITWPVFVILGGVIFLKEREEKHEILGLILAILGTLILVIQPLFAPGLRLNFIGNLLIIGQNLAIAAYYLLAKKYYRGFNKWLTTHISFLVGLAGFSIVSLLQGVNPAAALAYLITAPSLWPLLAVVYMGLFGSILGLTLYLIGQDKIEASEAAVFTYLEPAIAIPASFLLLGETVKAHEILGILIIAAGVILVEYRSRSARTSP